MYIASGALAPLAILLMMKKIYFQYLLFVFVTVLAVSFPRRSLAHASEPRLEINIERVNPGGVLDLRGVGFDYEEFVTLYLERPGIVVQLGDVTADLEGVFLHTIVLPVDLPEGVYNVRGVTSHHDVLSPSVTVQGSAILEGEAHGERDEDDPLLAPMPTYAPGVVPGGVVHTPIAQPAPQATPVFRQRPILLLGVSILLVLAVFFTFRWRGAAKE